MNVKLCSSGLLCSSWWWFLTDVSGQRIGPISKGQDIILLWCWNLNSNFCHDGGVLNLKCPTLPVTWGFKEHTDTGIECLCVDVECYHMCSMWCRCTKPACWFEWRRLATDSWQPREQRSYWKAVCWWTFVSVLHCSCSRGELQQMWSLYHIGLCHGFCSM